MAGGGTLPALTLRVAETATGTADQALSAVLFGPVELALSQGGQGLFFLVSRRPGCVIELPCRPDQDVEEVGVESVFGEALAKFERRLSAALFEYMGDDGGSSLGVEPCPAPRPQPWWLA